MRLSKSLFDNATKALSFCQMGLTRNCINIRPEVHIYALFHIVGWFNNFQIILFSASRIRLPLGDIR